MVIMATAVDIMVIMATAIAATAIAAAAATVTAIDRPWPACLLKPHCRLRLCLAS